MKPRTTNGPTAGFLDRLAASVGGRAGAASVFGAPVERDGLTVIPVAAARFGFGGGSGPTPDGKGEGGGGGGAASRPLGFIEIRGGRARFRRITDPVATGVGAVAIAMAVAIFARSAGRIGGACSACAKRHAEELPPTATAPDVATSAESADEVRGGR